MSADPSLPVVVGLPRALRAAGVAVSADRTLVFAAACARLGVGDADAVRRAGRATLCAGPDDLAVHDRVFEAWRRTWFGAKDAPETARGDADEVARASVGDADDAGAGESETALVAARASGADVLRHRDVALLDPADRARVHRLYAELTPHAPRRRAVRRTPSRSGEVDLRRTLRASLRGYGEPTPVARRRRGTRDRPVVLLVDVSGSMSAYADALLRLAHRMVRAGVATEVFTAGSRLTRVTPALRTRDPEAALVAAGRAVPDWAGGTRLGESLGAFLDRWGGRGTARRAVVVVLSDGWERGTAADLGREMARLGRLAHRVVWVNPHRGKDGYAPVQSGIVAALPHVDDFVAGHTLATFAEVCEVVARA
ncbi:vWA domain-containing protein [Nocardioides alkalitolerans]|uniref:vWA domain-containing protein n=1 Tax=Nocardioides alkalitolerans TaxID=281714 RepID=UPI0003FAF094|nr:VWA domain-containing protein [Nocardioides alkalitolerans]